jgi:hypothetical protein
MKRFATAVFATSALILGLAAAPAGAFPEQPSERGQGRACEVLPNAPGQERNAEVRPEEVTAKLTLQFADARHGLP